ncbi:N-acetylneuraminate synthase family protein [Candidatus Pelagibacter sp.]|nr:N-acetylneuraminate synthase family protein [Candidatus Pelagibacter sp.]
MQSFIIKKRRIGFNEIPLVIAELGINHFGSLELAIDLCDKAIASGVEAIKYQSHCLEDEMSIEAKKISPGNDKRNIYEVIKSSILSESEEKILSKYILQKNKILVATPFSRLAVKRIVKNKVDIIKIGSGECNNYPIVNYISKFKKPVIMSTGMNTCDSIKQSVNYLTKYKKPLVLLHCTNVYPLQYKDVNLNALKSIQKNFKNIILGYSDHTPGIEVSLAAISLGASVIEKHFTDTKKRKGPDITSSITPNELKNLINLSKNVFLSLGSINKKPVNSENKTINFAFSSVATLKNIKKGELFNDDNIFPMRPIGGDFKPKDFNKLIGKKAKIDIPKLTQLKKIHVY